MHALRRAALAIGIGALAAAILRMRGTDDTPAASGGWHELSDDDLMAPTRFSNG